MSACVSTVLRFRSGRLLVDGWPPGLAVPFGLELRDERIEGPARLRWRVRALLQEHGVPFADTITCTTSPPSPGQGPRSAAPFTALRSNGWRGIVAGLDETERTALVAHACRTLGTAPLVVAADSSAAHRWRRTLDVDARGCADAARDMHWLGMRHDVLVVDAPEVMPAMQLGSLLDASAALARIAFPSAAHWRLVQPLAARVGPVVHIANPEPSASCHELRVPLPPDRIAAYETAWSTFLGAFDRFVAAQPSAGFGTFVAQARRDPEQRPALAAWHRALSLAAWHEHKAVVVDELLQQHRNQRLLVFTPSRAVAYELACRHMIAAVTAELTRSERSALLDGFARGSLRALAGPRLLDLGPGEGSADVAILIGGGFGRDQRDARCRRIAPGGIVYELVSLDTVEVGRAHRWRDRATAHATAVHPH